MVFFDDAGSDRKYSGDALVSKQEYENCFIKLKKYVEKKYLEDEYYEQNDDCASNSSLDLQYPHRLFLVFNDYDKEKIIQNLELWNFESIDTNNDGFIETVEFYNHLMEGNPHSFWDPYQEGVKYEDLAHSINLPRIEKAIEYEWRYLTLLFNESDKFMNETLQQIFNINDYDLNFNGSVDFNEFRIVTYIHSYLGSIKRDQLLIGDNDFKDDVDEYKGLYNEELSKTGLNSEKNFGGACTNMSEYEAELLINTVNSFGYNFDFYDIQSCMYFNPRGFINFNNTDKTIYFDTNVAFFIQSTYGGTGVCLSPALGAYETSSQDECFN